MRIYNLTAVVKEKGTKTQTIKKDTIILADNDGLEDFVHMMYGVWYDIISFEVEEANIIHISKNYIAQEAMQMIRFD